MKIFCPRGIGLSVAQQINSSRFLAVGSRIPWSITFLWQSRRFASCSNLSTRRMVPLFKSCHNARSFSGFSNKPTEQEKTPVNQQQPFLQQQQMWQQNQAPVVQPYVKKGWSRRTKIIVGVIFFIVFVFVFFLLFISYKLGKIFEQMSYQKKLQDAFELLDENQDGLVTIDELVVKWESLKKEVATWDYKEGYEDEFKAFWSRIEEIGDKTLNDCNDAVLNIFQFSDLVAAVLFTAANVDDQDFITEADLRALAANFPEIKSKDVDKLMIVIFSEFDLDEDGQISLQDVRFRLRAELMKDSSLSKNKS